VADLFTLPELASFVQSDLDTATATLARELATAKVRTAAPRAFIEAGAHTVVRTIVGGVVTLPRPVTSVTSVTIDGDLIDADSYDFDGVDTISGLGAWDGPATVVYIGGYATAPTDVKAVALAVAGRIVDNPSGLRSETIGAYSATRAGEDVDIAGTELLASEVRSLRPWRRGAGTLRLR